jgi:hypothetical protein
MLDQRSIVLSIRKKGLSPKEISDDLVTAPDPVAMANRTVGRYVHDAKCIHLKASHLPTFYKSNQAILLALEGQPFSSVRQLSRSTHISRMTGYCG